MAIALERNLAGPANSLPLQLRLAECCGIDSPGRPGSIDGDCGRDYFALF